MTVRRHGVGEPLKPIGFWSYTRDDDKLSRGRLSQLRTLLTEALQGKIGKAERVRIFQDVSTIRYGRRWERDIDDALADCNFFIPIVTPGSLQSEWCCKELARFRAREAVLGRDDLIFPLIYDDIDDIDPDRRGDVYDRVAWECLRQRQAVDFRALRFKAPDSEELRLQLDELARAIRASLRREIPQPLQTPLDLPPAEAVERSSPGHLAVESHPTVAAVPTSANAVVSGNPPTAEPATAAADSPPASLLEPPDPQVRIPVPPSDDLLPHGWDALLTEGANPLAASSSRAAVARAAPGAANAAVGAIEPAPDVQSPATLTLQALPTALRPQAAQASMGNNKLVICSVFENAAVQLPEWLAYHGVVGVGHFVLYDNGSTDDPAQVIRNSPLAEHAALIRLPQRSGKLTAYRHFVDIFAPNFEWAVFLGVDEFLLPLTGRSVLPTLDFLDFAAAVLVHRRLFGPRTRQERPAGLAIESYCRRSADDFPANRHVRVIARCRDLIDVTQDPNEFMVSGQVVNTAGHLRPNTAIQTVPCYQNLVINHYCTGVREPWLAMVRDDFAAAGAVAPTPEKMEILLSQQADNTIQAFAPAVRELLGLAAAAAARLQ